MRRAGATLLITAGCFLAVGSVQAVEPIASHGAVRQAVQEATGGAMAVEYVGSDTCLTCHDDYEPWTEWSQHGSEAFVALSDQGCETCHGPGGLHMEDPEDPAHQLQLDRWTSIQTSEVCLTCHRDEKSGFHASNHALAGVSCTDCHSVHAMSGWAHDLDERGPFQTARVTGTSAMCASCHEDVKAEFDQPNAHPIKGGALDCASCHDPHEPASRVRLAAFGNQECASCHADKAGPFVFEHGSVMAEGCTACHEPHGSNNRHLLKFEQGGQLCYSCHDSVPAFHFGFNPAAPPRFEQNANCTACHSAIHGSNFHPFFLK